MASTGFARPWIILCHPQFQCCGFHIRPCSSALRQPRTLAMERSNGPLLLSRPDNPTHALQLLVEFGNRTSLLVPFLPVPSVARGKKLNLRCFYAAQVLRSRPAKAVLYAPKYDPHGSLPACIKLLCRAVRALGPVLFKAQQASTDLCFRICSSPNVTSMQVGSAWGAF